MLRLHDTARGEVVDLSLREPGRFSLYVCGPTVYDVPHIGHGRMVLVYDVLRRYLEWRGLSVRHVSNVTDIDDKIIRRAEDQGRSVEEVAAEYGAAWWDAVDRLGVLRPNAVPYASEYVEQMVELIAQLLARGAAYETADGVYFSTDAVEGYGLLARQPLESLRAGARVDVGEQKRSPLDFVLWKKAKPGEPSWPSPWGPGRPGWHTECVVMSLDLLGDGFDLHTGGLDLQFPHHENERVQALASGHAFARHWMHHAFVEVGGEKMSKSVGNFTSLADMLDRTDPRAYRLLVLQSHYRSPLEVTPRTVEQAERSLAGLDNFARRAGELPPSEPPPDVLDRFRAAMEDDLQTPLAVSLLFDTVGDANSALDFGDVAGAARAAAAVREMSQAVGLELRGASAEGVDQETVELLARRDAARARRDFAAADAIRAELQGRGWVVEDTPQGTRVHR